MLRRKTSDEITKLEINGAISNQSEEIKDGIVNFYRNLYEQCNAGESAGGSDSNLDDSFFSELKRVDDVSAAEVVKMITVEELGLVLDSCEDSAPGPDGIPYSILKHFWQDFGPVLVRAWEFSLKIKQLPPSHKQSYLRLIPKAGKDLSKIGNWRPITLSNTDHKLITKLLSRRLTTVVEKYIGCEQTAYIPGRLINDNIRAMLSTIETADLESQIDGLIISLDAKKAFDSVSHDYIEKTLRAFGLDLFVDIFRLLYKELRSDIIINGEIKVGYKILRGVKQGDALSCILFIMCMEPLIRNIKKNKDIVPIESRTLEGDLPKVYSFADDITTITVNNVTSEQSIFDEYQRLTKISGLTLNADKTELLRINKRVRDEVEFQVNYCGNTFMIKSQAKVKINGVTMLQDREARMRENCMKINAAMESHLAAWSTRALSLMGKILIVKTFAISQIIFYMQSSQITEKYLKMFESTIFKFLWNKNMSAAKAPDRIKREIMMTPVKYGGFGMLNVRELDHAIKLKVFGRFLTSEHPQQKRIRSKSSLTNLFEVSAPKVDSVLTEAVRCLNEDRNKILDWELDIQKSNLSLVAAVRNIKIKEILTSVGKQSMPFLLLQLNSGRGLEVKVKDLAPNDFVSISRHLKNRQILTLLQECSNLNVPEDMESLASLYPVKVGQLGDLRKLQSKVIREARSKESDQIICIYKIGLVLTPGEVINWTSKLRKLTSVRHRSILLRVAHGEIYSNSRLFKFGLIPSPACNNCENEQETIEHKIIECRAASISWELLNRAKIKLGLQSRPTELEEIMGASMNDNDRMSLTLNAELLQQIESQGGTKYDPHILVQQTLKSIIINEPMEKTTKNKLSNLVST